MRWDARVVRALQTINRAAGLGIAYKAKPIVAAETRARIQHTDLRAALFFQGYAASEIVSS